jgi:hypothetical protein
MQIICPKGCHQKPNWSYSLERRECYEDGQIFEMIRGETCDDCGEFVHEVDPQAEAYCRRRRLLRILYWVAAALVLAVAAGVPL